MTLVVCVCSASTVITAKGSGRRKTSRLDRPSAATTEQMSAKSLEERDEGVLTCNSNLFAAAGVSSQARLEVDMRDTHGAP